MFPTPSLCNSYNLLSIFYKESRMSLHSDTTCSCKTLLSQCEIDISSRFAITSERICAPVCTHASVRVDYTLKKGWEYTGMRGTHTHTQFFPVASIISTYFRHNEQWVWHIIFYCNIILLWLLRCVQYGVRFQRKVDQSVKLTADRTVTDDAMFMTTVLACRTWAINITNDVGSHENG